MSFTMLETSKDSNALEEHQHMYLFVYKTTHVNGKYYIGRHQTDDLNDGYLGSGKWVNDVKDKSSLSREIITEAKSVEELFELEEHYINLYWDDPLCMNMMRGSNGWTSEDAKKAISTRLNPFQTRPDGTSLAKDKVDNGTHPWQTRPDRTNANTDRVKAGTHNWQRRPDGTSHATDRVKAGTHPWQTRPDGTNANTDRVKAGTNPFLKNKGTVACYNKQGEYKRIPKKQFHSQKGSKEDWEWVGITSKEGKRRKLLEENKI